MHIREKIGERITQARKALGITIKELAARTGELSAARISNWEQGTRSPGPMEAKLLASALNVSASFLLCLTDNPSGEISLNRDAPRVVPMLKMNQALLAKEILHDKNLLENSKSKILFDSVLGKDVGTNIFALFLEDNSMEPEFHKNDLIIVDADAKPIPGDYVLVYIPKKEQSYLRKYSESSTNNCLYQLLAHNELWPTIEVTDQKDAIILGTIIEYRRFF